MERDAGGDYGLVPAEWGPATGPVHPACTCARYGLYDERLVAAMTGSAE